MWLSLNSLWRMQSIFVMAHIVLSDSVTDPLGYSEALDYSSILLRMREESWCPTNYYSCDDQGEQFIGACCQNDQKCALDAHQSAACCPAEATCTGVAPAKPTMTPTYVSNAYFPFPIVPTSFANPADCSSYLSDCHKNYDACVSGLAGGRAGYGVTIEVPGATTVAQVQTSLPSATVTEVCSTLSLQACHGLSGGACHAGTHGAIVVGTATNNAAPRPTAACMAGVIAGVGLGIINGHL
ncbi:hypothetical protein F5Y17DRAFT_439793 [Xylariaceae sp. FL0594]|nr:hypothetical protein F5Y17DRAFT_439793 [Xylariaceae sp. FL0594]